MPDLHNLYETPLDFKALALEDAEFARYFKDYKLDFSDAAAVKQLTISLLKRDFGLHVDLPDDRLCPPIPNRLAYILWIQDLIDSTSDSLSEAFEPEREVIGLDIGTGSSCIYPLLGCTTRKNWKFIATGLKFIDDEDWANSADIDGKNLDYARGNVRRNSLDDRIKIYKSTPSGPLIPLDLMKVGQIDFVLTNPPFYTSTASMLESAALKSRPPFSACTGSEVEMVVAGGEVAFVRRIIEESLILRNRVQWYSAMLGKLDSVRELLEILNQKGLNDIDKHGTANWAVKEFVQGTKTRRWALAWSWGSRRPAMHIARGTQAVGKQLLPFPALFAFDVTGSTSAEVVSSQVNELMTGLDFRWKYRPSLFAGVGFAEKDVWSRAARRNKGREMDVDIDNDEDDEDEDHEPALAIKITVRSSEEISEATSVTVRWLIGRDNVLFESFCGMVKREIGKKNQ